MSTLADLAAPRADYTFAFLDEHAKREVRRSLLKAVCIPGYQVPYASREVPMARGWGTGGLQVTLSVIGERDTLKVTDQGADDSVNAVNIRRFVARMTGVVTTTDTLEATLIQSRHRIPEERLREGQILILQVPLPDPFSYLEPSRSKARELHADSDYALLWLRLYEDLTRRGEVMTGADHPVSVHGHYVMAPSPIPRFDVPKLHQAPHLTLLSAGREKKLYAVPPYTDVQPLAFTDVPFQIERQEGWVCAQSGVSGGFMTELPLPGGGARYVLSDTGLLDKLVRARRGEAVTVGETYTELGPEASP
ncbi:alpha-D-ribose 1-methylphosphonate 5-phosphate C-P-lyase PhnJ [Deinococcus sp.]|uniref:alpha-D-ribose 1-methylphosphonate 5-phosphate C-P-lyase PhnJ n=1 Tax=Deinococcus sp. TaxID=47478 RepID=UPI0025D3B40B|nr:alpha-D-ribose 1-methylphosphonate 5-phosphate C-P-lyase PhnJ [Deinococcus sp.]